jgi:hypothetical protein
MNSMVRYMTPQTWDDAWRQVLDRFKDLPAAWAQYMQTQDSTSSASQGRSSAASGHSSQQEAPVPHRLLGLLLTDAQVGEEIPLKSWRKLVVTDEVSQCCCCCGRIRSRTEAAVTAHACMSCVSTQTDTHSEAV